MKDAARRSSVWLIPLAIVLLALGLRLYRLDAQSLWNDEGTSVALAQRDLPTITRNAAGDIHPPLYYYLLHVWVRLVGQSEFAVRSLSALAGAALVGATYVVGQRLFGRLAAIVAALVSALSPFQIYYSQEARMYVFVSLFGLFSMAAYGRLLAGLLGETSGGRSSFHRRHWGLVLSCGAYILASVLMIYSQYFGFTLLLAQNIGFLVWLLWRRRELGRSAFNAVPCWVGMQLCVALCYLPWLALSWRSLRNWPAIAAPLPLARLATDVMRVFALGQTVGNGPSAGLVSWAFALLVAVGMFYPRDVSEASAGPKDRPQRKDLWGVALMALYLLVPVLAMYGFSLHRPMYRPKFLLLATPAYYLLLARGVVACGRWVGRLTRARWISPACIAALVVVVCIASACSLSHLYFDTRYYRDDYRGIVAYINATAGPEDAILINAPSQIETVAYYYRGPLAQYPLPLERPMDRAKTEAALQDIVARHSRLYVILWATAESDPGRFVEGWLDQHCFKALESWFGNVRLAVYAVPRSPARDIQHPLGYMLGESIRLKGYSLLTPEPRSGDILQLALFWEAVQPVGTRYKVFVHLVDGRGNIVGQRDGEPAGGSRPTLGWLSGEVIVDNCGVPIPPGTPPGRHVLRVGMYALDDGRRLEVSEAGRGIGDAIDLVVVDLQPSQIPPPIAALDIQHRGGARWGGLELIGHSLYRLGFEHQPELPLRPGDVGKLILFWRKVSGPLAQGRFIISLIDRAGRSVWEQRLQIAGGTFPLDAWREGEVVRDIHQLPLPRDLAPGSYRLTLRPDDAAQRPYTLTRVTLSK